MVCVCVCVLSNICLVPDNSTQRIRLGRWTRGCHTDDLVPLGVMFNVDPRVKNSDAALPV